MLTINGFTIAVYKLIILIFAVQYSKCHLIWPNKQKLFGILNNFLRMYIDLLTRIFAIQWTRLCQLEHCPHILTC